MKRRFLSWFASAVMLCGAAALFAYQPSTRTAANASGVTARNVATIPMPTKMDLVVLNVVPANNPTAVGEEITVAKLSAILATNPDDVRFLADKFKVMGWEWSAQTKVKVSVVSYRVTAGEENRIAPQGWDWKQAMAASDRGPCIFCIEGYVYSSDGSCGYC